MASIAKVAIDAAMPDSRISTRPKMRAARAANNAASTADCQYGKRVASSHSGNPGSEPRFIIGLMVSQAAA